MSHRTQNWIVRKPVARSAHGVVVSQSLAAAEVGARILAEGGNAVDAAVATGFALAALEPWNSGLGGIGYMVVWQARERRAHVVEFGPVAPARLDPAQFPLAGGTAGDLFTWPAVVEDRNVHGPLSLAVPGEVDGLGLALERFGTLAWPRVLAPAIELAEAGLPLDWFATLRISLWARELARYPTSACVWLPDALPAATPTGAALRRLVQPGLAATLRRLAQAGRRDFYEGDVARRIAEDVARFGGVLDRDDLAAYRARVVEPLELGYRDLRLFAAGGLTAGPSLATALGLLAQSRLAESRPGPIAFAAYADALSRAYAERLETMGEVSDVRSPASTTHLNVVDRDGNMVALTQTLLSVFGSKLTLPQTGILMNNGVMWLDPRPGRPNSLGPGKRPLTNMCPVVAARGADAWFAIGASGGRKIMPAVAQIISFIADFGMGLDDAFHHPRIDASGEREIGLDARLPANVAAALRERHPVRLVEQMVLPVNFACPCAVMIDAASGERVGISDVMSPWSGAAVPSVTGQQPG